MDTEKHVEDAEATAIIAQKVLPGWEHEYETWQQDVNAAAAGYDGYLGVEVTPPTALQPEWVVVYRYDSVAHLQAWINSPTRQGLLEAGDKYLDGPGTQQVVSGHATSRDPLVTVVITHRVHPEHVEDFLAWQRRMNEEESKFEGFRGSEFFPPIEGVQEEWTTLYRFDNAEHLDAWLTSDRRQEVLAEERSSTSNCARSTTPSAAGSPSRRTAGKRPRPRSPRPPSRSGSACTRPSSSWRSPRRR